MTTSVEHGTQLEKLVSWIRERDNAEVSVRELFVHGPSILGMSELELREWVNEGLKADLLTLGGLANVVQVRNDETAA